MRNTRDTLVAFCLLPTVYIITFIKAGRIFIFRNFFQKLSEFRQLPKTRVYKNIDFCLFCVYFYVNNTQDLYSFI